MLLMFIAAVLAKDVAVELDCGAGLEIGVQEGILLPAAKVIDQKGQPVKRQPDLTWEVLPATAARVESGKLLPQRDGKATLRVKAGEFTADCAVAISIPAEIVLAGQSRFLVTSLTEVQMPGGTVVDGLGREISPQPGFGWTTSAPEIVRMDGSVAIPQRSGSAVLTAKVRDGGASAKVNFKVTLPDAIAFEGATAEQSIFVGDSMTVKAVVTSRNQAIDFEPVKWESSNPAVVSVDGTGNVKAVKDGRATVTASAGSARASFNVAVEATPVGAQARIAKRRSLIVAMDTGTPPGSGAPPMFYVGDDGRDDGFDVQVAKQLAKSLRATEVQIIATPYSELTGTLTASDTVDVVVSGYVADKSVGVIWSDSYLDFGLCLVVPVESKVNELVDLSGKVIGIVGDSPVNIVVERLTPGRKELKAFEAGYLDALASGKIDALIHDYPHAVAEIEHWYAEHPGKRDAFRIAKYNLTKSWYSVGVRSSEPELLAAANQALRALRSSDAYRDLIAKYLAAAESKVAIAAGPPVTNVGGASVRTYAVAPGDTLETIATKQLGSIARWKELWEMNRDRLASPYLLRAGMEIYLPAE